MSFREKRGHRHERIERAAAEILECDLLPSLDDPNLSDLHVVNVRTAGGLACLHVLLAPGKDAAERDADQVNTALSRVEGKLRSELAGILRIKRMPLLRLHFVPLPVQGGEGGGE